MCIFAILNIKLIIECRDRMIETPKKTSTQKLHFSIANTIVIYNKILIYFYFIVVL